MRRFATTTTIIYLVTIYLAISFAGCLSEEDAATIEYEQLLWETGLGGSGDGKSDWGDGSNSFGEFALCKVLTLLGDDVANQHLISVQGETWDMDFGPVKLKVLPGYLGGAEYAVDLANYHMATFEIVGTTSTIKGKTFKLASGGYGAYRGIMVGKHDSVLDAGGIRVGGSATVSPFLPFLDIGFHAFGKVDLPLMVGGAVKLGASLKVGAKAILGKALFGGMVPRLGAEGGWWRAIGDSNLETVGATVGLRRPAEIAQRDADLGAQVNHQCPGYAFVEYNGRKEDADAGYHTKRARAISEAIKRNGGLLNGLFGQNVTTDWDLASKALARVALAIGVARDHGGIGAVCSGTSKPGELSPAPPPSIRCPDNSEPVTVQDTDENNRPIVKRNTEENPDGLPTVKFENPLPDATVTPEPLTVKVSVTNNNFKSIQLQQDSNTGLISWSVDKWVEGQAFEYAGLRLPVGAHELKAIIIDKDGKPHDGARISVTSQKSAVNNTTTNNGVTDNQASAEELLQKYRAEQEAKKKEEEAQRQKLLQSQLEDDGCSLAPTSGSSFNSSLPLLLLALLFCVRRRRRRR